MAGMTLPLTLPTHKWSMHILKFDSESAWVACLASLWRDRLRTQPSLRLCLAAGHTPVPVYRAVAQSVQAGWVSFRQAQVFALDEYGGLDCEDPGRCANQLRRSLIQAVDLPAERFHFLRPEAEDLQQECARYDQVIEPGFDLVVLGVGLNGHVGMNEPGTPPTAKTHWVQLQPSSIQAAQRYSPQPKAPTWGLTVGLKHLLDAREVWLLARGQTKAQIVQRIVKGPITPQVPASLFRDHPNCWLVVDAEAGSGL
jgi:glucosamine-6-phosphate isomerase